MTLDINQFRLPRLSPVKFSPPVSPRNQKYCGGAKRLMKFPAGKLLPALIFVLASLSFLRLLKIAITTSSPAPPPLQVRPPLASPSPACIYNVHSNETAKTSLNPSIITKKEFKLLSDFITRKPPCNMLIFGLEPQYLTLSSINAQGITVILEDDPAKIEIKEMKSNNTRIYKAEYHMVEVKRAYKLLKYARNNPACMPNPWPIQQSKCKLTLKNLPKEVYETRWDVILVDGPSGEALESPGRMKTIYTAALLARAGNTADVFVHDTHRTVEKWFSWEFLCEEKLVSSKGNMWHFRFEVPSKASRFCSPMTAPVE